MWKVHVDYEINIELSVEYGTKRLIWLLGSVNVRHIYPRWTNWWIHRQIFKLTINFILHKILIWLILIEYLNTSWNILIRQFWLIFWKVTTHLLKSSLDRSIGYRNYASSIIICIDWSKPEIWWPIEQRIIRGDNIF